MPRKYYTNVAPLVTLASGISDSATTLTVASTSGYPTSYPFVLTLERATVNEEVVLCTAKNSTQFTVTRGWDGTTAKAHLIGAAIEHTSSAADYADANAHVYDTTRDDHTQYAGKVLWSAKGVIVVGSDVSTPTAVTVGGNNTVLLADSAQGTGVKWGTIVAASITDGVIALAKLDSSLKQSVIQKVANTAAVSSPVAGQEVYDQSADRWAGYVTGGWVPRPHGIGKVTLSLSTPSGGVDGDVWFQYV